MATIPSLDLTTASQPTLAQRLVVPLILASGVASGGLIWLAMRDPIVAFAFGAVVLGAAALVLALRRRNARERAVGDRLTVDRALIGDLIAAHDHAVVITDRSGRLVTANDRYESRFGGLLSPPQLGLQEADEALLADAARGAWRDGEAVVSDISAGDARLEVRVQRAGLAEDYLIWRFLPDGASDLARRVALFLEGGGGDRLGESGVMAALVDATGIVLAANGALVERAGAAVGLSFTTLLRDSGGGCVSFVREGPDGPPLRLIAIPIEQGRPTGPAVLVLIDESMRAVAVAEASAAPVHVQGLLAMLPLGLSLVDRDGRFLFMNDAFRRAAGISGEDMPVYPGDLVIKEDKGAVSDAVRRFAAGRALAGDVAVRLAQRPDEPIALTVATAKGLGEAAVLLSLKDNSEESKLKRQVAQATKMQAVGQLAGGVAHDFNNILTAIIGHCDLMLMRHTPGDSDYDDIQQIKHNSNRAASLTRQLLAFSRQQTLRPQLLQLPDVISEISNLLKRLLGETVKLEVKHGRNLGPVRADPGQLEQVIVNLAVNARDAMPSGGTVTLQTYAVSAAEARRIDSDILPPADYTVLSVSDTGTGIPPEILGKIFEPFFTTKEVGKGTGLGLSTVYGIVKQTGGFIFADSVVGGGTTFTIYLPVHHGEKESEAQAPVRIERKTEELWGTGTILLVEDEAMVRAVAERALTRQGYQLLTATNGEEALEVLESCEAEGRRIDLLISDVVMPTMDGPTLVGHARKRFPDLPILFMSGYAEEQLRNMISIDHVAFLPKPFSVQQLGQAARDALNGKK